MQVGGRGALGRGSVETLSIGQGVSAGGVGAFWNEGEVVGIQPWESIKMPESCAVSGSFPVM